MQLNKAIDHPGVLISRHTAAMVQAERKSAAQLAGEKDDFLSMEDILRQVANVPAEIPWKPTGHMILVLLLSLPEKIGNIHINPETLEAQANASPQGVVLMLGPGAYAEKDRFPGGPLCHVGQRIQLSKYSGRAWRHRSGLIMTTMNDDEVLAVAEGDLFEIIGREPPRAEVAPVLSDYPELMTELHPELKQEAV